MQDRGVHERVRPPRGMEYVRGVTRDQPESARESG